MRIRTLLLLLLSLPFAYARSAEPVDSFLNALVQGAGENLWWVYPKEINGQTIKPPKGGYILRIKIDLNGDGLDDVFLTTDDEVMKGGESWTLYRGGAAGTLIKLSDNLWLQGALWVKTSAGVKKYSYVAPQDKDTGLEEINTFWIDSSGSCQTSEQQLTEAQSKAINGGDQALMGANGLPDENKIAQYLNIGTPVAISIQKVLVGKLYQSRTASWRALNNTFSLSQQYLDPADAADIASLESWTPPSNP